HAFFSSVLLCSGGHPHLPSFPTRRSSDLELGFVGVLAVIGLFAALAGRALVLGLRAVEMGRGFAGYCAFGVGLWIGLQALVSIRSEEHTSELQSRENLVCRLLLEKKKKYR